MNILQAGYIPPHTSWKLIRRLDDDTSGFGDIWLARHEITEDYGVCKFCKAASQLNVMQSLANEARLASKIEHPGVVRLRETHLAIPQHPFLVFDFVPGKDLAHALLTLFSEPLNEAAEEISQPAMRLRFEPLDHEQAASAMLKLAEIVSAAHAVSPRAIVHRDLKPQNIMVANYDDLAAIKSLGIAPDFRLAELKVLDFGIGGFSTAGSGASTIARSAGREFDGLHTRGYGSPQQMRGELPEEADDVYALGLIWLELLSGELYLGPPSGRWKKRLLEAGASETQVEVLEACLEETRTHRIPDAGELSERIRVAYPHAAENPDLRKFMLSVAEADEDGWALQSSARTLSVEAARLIGMLWREPVEDKSISLELNSLENLPVHVAEELFPNQTARSCDTYFSLNRLTELSSDVAVLMGNVLGECYSIELNGLASISARALAALMLPGFAVGSLSLKGLQTLPADVAGKFKPVNEFDELDLSGLKELSPLTANQLMDANISELSLDGIESLPSEVAEILARFDRHGLYLNGIRRISESAIIALMQCKADQVTLGGIESLSLRVAKRIASEGPAGKIELSDAWDDAVLGLVLKQSAGAGVVARKNAIRALLLSLPINEFASLSMRLRRTLETASIRTAGDLAAQAKKDFADLRVLESCGETVVNELKKLVEKYDLV